MLGQFHSDDNASLPTGADYPVFAFEMTGQGGVGHGDYLGVWAAYALPGQTEPTQITDQGLPWLYAEQKALPQAPAMHPLQQAFIDVQAIQCGYCYNGMTIKASELLAKNPKPTEAEIRAHMNGHLCRCGSYPRVMQAIVLAGNTMAGDVR